MYINVREKFSPGPGFESGSPALRTSSLPTALPRRIIYHSRTFHLSYNLDIILILYHISRILKQLLNYYPKGRKHLGRTKKRIIGTVPKAHIKIGSNSDE